MGVSDYPDGAQLAAIPVRDNPEASRFEMDIGGLLAISNYRLDGNVVRFTHTEVPEALRGKGVASRLIGATLDTARERQWMVIPQCSAVASYMRRYKATQDLLAPQARAIFAARDAD